MFELTRSQKEIQKAARDFAKGEFAKELSLELEKNHEFPRVIWEKAADLGFIGVHFSEKYSGGGLGLLENSLIAEEFCRKDSAIGVALTSAAIGSECLVRYGIEELKSRFLPQVAEGTMLSATAFTEPDKGTDLSNTETTAAKDGDEWVISGTKTVIVNGGTAGFYVLLCRTKPDAGPAKGLSMFLVESDFKGLSVKDLGEKLGFRMVASAEISFSNVKIPAKNLIGGEGKGFNQAQAFLDEYRILIAGQALGIAQGAFDHVLDYIKGREQFGRKIADFQISRHKIAEMAVKIELARVIIYKTAWDFDQGQRDSKQVAMAKMTATRAALEVASEAVQLHGGYGYMTEYEVERFYRDAKVADLCGGTRGVLKDLIGNMAIGRIR